MSNDPLSLRQSETERGDFYTSGDLALLKQVHDRVIAELRRLDSPALANGNEAQTHERVARAIMDLAETGIRDPDTLESLSVKAIVRG